MRRFKCTVGLAAATLAGGALLGVPAATGSTVPTADYKHKAEKATNTNASEENNQGVLNGNNVGVNVPIQACGLIQANVLPILGAGVNSVVCETEGSLSQDNNRAGQSVTD